MAQRPNCGLCRLPGTLRTSTRCDISCDVSKLANRSASRVPWPTVYKAVSIKLLTSRSRGGTDAEHLFGLANHLVGETPLVVVPTHDLDQGAIDHTSHLEIHDRCTRIADDVGRNQWLLGDAEDASITI